MADQRAGRPSKYGWADMPEEERVFIETDDAQKIRVSASQYSRRTGERFKVEKADGGVFVRRVKSESKTNGEDVSKNKKTKRENERQNLEAFIHYGEGGKRTIEKMKKKVGQPPKWPLREMEIGDSLWIPQEEARSARGAASRTEKIYGMVYITRKKENENGEPGIKLWRIG